MSYIAEAIKSGVRAGLLNSMGAMPGIIQSFDSEAQTVVVQISIMRIVDGKDEPYTLCVDVPILLPTVQGFHLTMPIKAKDECLLIFADRCIDGWFDAGDVQRQVEHRVHHISDAFAMIGVNSSPNTIPSYDTDSMVIRNTANSQKITLKPSGDIDIDTTANVNVTCTQATVKASSSVTLDTPSTVVTGKLAVTGPITSAASVTAPMVEGSTDVVFAGISGKGHVHGGVQSGPSTTSAPQ